MHQAHRIELSGESMRKRNNKTISSLGETDKKNNFAKLPANYENNEAKKDVNLGVVLSAGEACSIKNDESEQYDRFS